MRTTLDSALLAFYDFTVKHEGIPPSYGELAAALGLASRPGAYYWGQQLIARGYLRHAVPERTEQRGPSSDLVLTDAGRARLWHLRRAA